ncbi:hypothetical protein MYK68_00260 [Gordonia sp. PP30]|uniref:hypothetical protein n=1 Tax=Gordonia sp. PP30 TaxID=2935861 RepID=UPI00200059B6|nr:hypothetical protein [Gordonia sp. PP30]UQE75120.1 hypothetical protein MYK68_00260 [Gordonia sp. PP30]
MSSTNTPAVTKFVELPVPRRLDLRDDQGRLIVGHMVPLSDGELDFSRAVAVTETPVPLGVLPA